MIDLLALHDVGRLAQPAEQRQPAIAEVIAAGAIVDEADDLVAELAMLEDLVGDHPPEVARAGDENAPQPDAGGPAPLERLAHQLARQIAERDVEDQEDGPHPPRHFVGAGQAQLRPARSRCRRTA